MAFFANDMKCLNPNCRKKATRRGLCDSDYELARRRVCSRKTSWAKLQRAGLVLPAFAKSKWIGV